MITVVQVIIDYDGLSAKQNHFDSIVSNYLFA